MENKMFGRKVPRYRNVSELCCAFTSELRRIWFNPFHEINVNNTGTLKRVPADGTSVRFVLSGLKKREYEVRNREYAMDFLKGL